MPGQTKPCESLPLQTRMAPIGSVNAENRTAILLWTAGATGRRYDWTHGRYYSEELSMDPAHVRMDRFQSGKAPLLNSHSSCDVKNVIGVIESASGAEAVVRFSSRDDVEPIFQDVKDRILRNVSVGYAIYKREMIAPTMPDGDWTYRIIDWEPMELSIVAIPFDAGAEIRSAGDEKQQRTFEVINLSASRSLSSFQENHMSGQQSNTSVNEQEILTRERQRMQDIRAAVRSSQLDNSEPLIEEYIARGLSIEAVHSDVFRRMYERNQACEINSSGIMPGNANGNSEGAIQRMADALVSRLTGARPPESARQYSGYRMVDFARDILQSSGVRTTSLSPNELIVRSLQGLHTTSDFPSLLQMTGERLLRQAYGNYQGGIRRVAKETTARDFRAKNSIMLGEAPGLLKVLEGAEFTRGTMAESKESYRLETFGRIFGISRQALVNDDLDAFGDLTRRLGMAAAEFVANQLVDLLISNPVMSDTNTLFHAAHKNVAAAGGAISDATLAAARLAMRTQRGLDGKTVIDVTPKFLIVPAALEHAATKYLASIQPATVADVNPFSGALELVVDPRLDVVSATGWYLAADPGAIDTIEYAYLEESPGPTIESRAGFEVDGLEMKVRLDFGAGILDYRGLYRNAGA
jgi:hypothetical protein